MDAQQPIFGTKLGSILRYGRESFNMFIQPKTFKRGLAENIKNKKVQNQYANDTRFFCEVDGFRSKTVPTSVHKLRPGDIDIVGAIGDSLTAANGAFAIDVLQVLLEGRGASWAIGGQQTWRNFLTIPNILKEFNPNLYGQSTTDQARTYEKAARFNVAEPGVNMNLKCLFN